MTVIVQPITIPPSESASDVITQHLQKLLGTLTYENFAATQTGEVSIYDTKFYYRVGLFLAVPTEAIIAAGQFVKMHQIKERAKWWVGLKVIDPERPEDCLYEYSNGDKHWEPPVLPTTGAGQQSTVFAQQSIIGRNGLAGYSGQQYGPNYLANQLASQGPYLSQTAARQALKQKQTPPPGMFRKLFGTP